MQPFSKMSSFFFDCIYVLVIACIPSVSVPVLVCISFQGRNISPIEPFFFLPFTVATLNECKLDPAAVVSTSSPLTINVVFFNFTVVAVSQNKSLTNRTRVTLGVESWLKLEHSGIVDKRNLLHSYLLHLYNLEWGHSVLLKEKKKYCSCENVLLNFFCQHRLQTFEQIQAFQC